MPFKAVCNSATYLANKAEFDYFDFDTAFLTGSGALTGLDLLLTERPTNGNLPPQLGYGANNKDKDEFGLSTWLFWNVSSNITGVNYANGGVGDINIELTAVPLPATLPLLLGAFGILGWVRHKNR